MHVHVPEAIASKVEGVLLAMSELYGDRAEEARIQVHSVKPGDLIHVSKRFAVRGVPTTHRGPSIGWAVEETVSKLKPEFKGMEGKEIGRIRASGTTVTDDKVSTMLCIPGDTQIEFLLEQEQARKAKILLHEVTVWDEGYANVEGCRRYGHTHIAEMAEHCEKFEGDALVLVHRSMRYSRKEIEEIGKKRLPASMLPKIHFFDGGDR
jgi:ribonuclease Z